MKRVFETRRLYPEQDGAGAFIEIVAKYGERYYCREWGYDLSSYENEAWIPDDAPLKIIREESLTYNDLCRICLKEE